MLLAISHLTRLDVKWANYHQGDTMFYRTPHANPYYQLILVTDGPVYFQSGGERTELQTGECVLLMPWQPHEGWKPIGERAGFFWVQFSADPDPVRHEGDTAPVPELRLAGGGASDLRTRSDMPMNVLIPRRLHIRRRFELSLLFEKLVKDLHRPHGYFRLRSALQLWDMLHLLAEELLEQSQVNPALPASFAAYRRIVNHLEENYQRDIAKEELSALLGRTYEHLSSVFKRYAGMTVTHYIQQLRLQRALYLLQNTDKPVSEVAVEAGFKDPYYFSRLFKKHTGVAPSAMRAIQPGAG